MTGIDPQRPRLGVEFARQLDPPLVDDDLVKAIRTGLDDPEAGYAERAAALPAPFSHGAVDQTVARVLPRLLSP